MTGPKIKSTWSWSDVREPVDIGDLLEVGGKAIYEMRSHPKKAPWPAAAAETRASYRARMQELLNAVSKAGFKITRGKHVKPD